VLQAEPKRNRIEQKEEKNESPRQNIEEECNFHPLKEDDEIHSSDEKEIGSKLGKQWTSADKSTTEKEKSSKNGNRHTAFQRR